MLVLLQIAFAATLGFAAHRAGICAVKAVVEIATNGRAHLLLSFAKTSLWIMLALWVAGHAGGGVAIAHVEAGPFAIVGGMLFGVGAAMNGGCAFSTMSRASDGDTSLVATVLAWPLGMAAWNTFADALGMLPAASAIRTGASLGPVLGGLLVAWALVEITRVARRLRRAPSIRRLLGAEVYALAPAALVIGGANAVILLTDGPWSFIGTFHCAVGRADAVQCTDPLRLWLLFAGAVAGMGLSAWQRGAFRLRRPQQRALARHGSGGFLMGVGAAAVPGGNDGLILFAIPGLSPHALPAYLGILAGIALVITTMRLVGGTMPAVYCEDDICRGGPPAGG
jgi:uncharacterized protein